MVTTNKLSIIESILMSIEKEAGKTLNKPFKIYGRSMDDATLEQFFEVMMLDSVVQGAVMPDGHKGYVLNIGGVVATDGVIFPSFVGYDIGCGMCALKTPWKKEQIDGLEDAILSEILKRIPCGEGLKRAEANDKWDYSGLRRTEIVEEGMIKGIYQLGTLGGGNHFIEIGYDEGENIWIIIHSGSRGLGHYVATEYMKIAKSRQVVDTTPFEEEFDANEHFHKLRKIDIEKYEEIKGEYVHKKIKEVAGSSNIEGTFGLDINSEEGRAYIDDMNFCLEYAEENRMIMMEDVLNIMSQIIDGVDADFSTLFDDSLINSNHNHAEERDGYWIHRKGATHAENGMMGVIPGNMRDGSFVVRGKGNPDSLFSSSHGAGRAMSRREAKDAVSMEDFKSTMQGVTAVINENTLDENPFAYKNIFEVMEDQKDLVEVIHHIKPLINAKG